MINGYEMRFNSVLNGRDEKQLKILNRVETVMDILDVSKRSRIILTKRSEGLTYREIGDMLGLTTARICQIFNSECEKIRKGAMRVGLRSA
jgi:DNA-directed RNA polymerase specialized sigma subunit